MKSTNPESKPINQKRGPTVGNDNPGSKRGEFQAAKKASGSQRGELAKMVTSALEARGRGMQSHRDKSVEPLKANVNVGRGPTKGNKA